VEAGVGYVRGTLMVNPSQKIADNGQRIQVELQTRADGKEVRIRLESYDEGLGWYSSGSLNLPLHQLPLLEQAIADMRNEPLVETAEIIPFPGPIEQEAG
jgi:hypothetical protein